MKKIQFTIRKRVYLPAICIFLLIFLIIGERIYNEFNPPYVEQLKGVAEGHYDSGVFINGDSLLLVKISQVESADFQRFVDAYGMTLVDNLKYTPRSNFYEKQEWWPDNRELLTGKILNKKDERSEFFVCLIDNVCYISLSTW